MWSHRRIESTRADPVQPQMGSKVSARRLCGMPFASDEQAEAAVAKRELDVVARTESVCATASCQSSARPDVVVEPEVETRRHRPGMMPRDGTHHRRAAGGPVRSVTHSGDHVTAVTSVSFERLQTR